MLSICTQFRINPCSYYTSIATLKHGCIAVCTCICTHVNTGSISVTTPIQSITPTQVAMATSMTASSVRPSMSQVVTLGLSLLGSTNSASLTSGITQTAIAPSLVLATSGALLPLPSQATQLLESVTPTSPDAGRSQDKEGSLSTGLIVGLAFLFLPLITFVSIVISLVAIIFLRKRKEKKIKSKSTPLVTKPIIVCTIMKKTQDNGMFKKNLWHSQHHLKGVQSSTSLKKLTNH